MRNEGRRPVWREPRPGDAPARRGSDWLLVGAFELVAVGEAIFRPDVAWRPLATLVALAAAPVLLWRRSHPLVAALVGFGAVLVLSVAQLVTGSGDLGLYAMMFVLILLYSLVRWGSGREVVLGLGFVSVTVALGMYVSFTGWADVFGGTVFLLMFVALAAAFRYRADVWHRQLAEIRNQERVGLARELHDTVAHHVSAIAVQAQAGRAVADTSPEAAVATLAAIESEASRTLAEMRAMVRVLRDGQATEYAPQAGIADLSALASSDDIPVVQVTLTGELGHLPRGIDAAVYRLARESLTNALRHAHHAGRVLIEVAGEPDVVRLRVADDGEPDPSSVAAPGFGLIGMAERAQLLGGTLSAGPSPGGGWTVRAEFPRELPS
ncbi:MAG TPA: sensor histidine kinase [Nocardioides sp.]|uniref:sensor histidine kinase n=1 Tax=Nocardioides sp. TaxID=35761 RepID=UPI002C182EAA|nr:sensor histidine kinase [Nocardioides sp.]HQR28146.1 sensor histidine kinase [Nocardioides sp.]